MKNIKKAKLLKYMMKEIKSPQIKFKKLNLLIKQFGNGKKS